MSGAADLNPVLRTVSLPAPSHPPPAGPALSCTTNLKTFLKKRGDLNPTARSGVLLLEVRIAPFDLEEELPSRRLSVSSS